jgi:hypothetical protein
MSLIETNPKNYRIMVLDCQYGNSASKPGKTKFLTKSVLKTFD